MNVIEKECVEVLKKLKDNYGVFEIKSEFEAEGTRMEELMRLKDIVDAVNLPIILKIGGAEAVTDVYNAVIVGVGGIIAPMVETSYAVSKFLGIIETYVQPDNREDIDFAINIETITAYENIDDILSMDKIDYLSSITLGRSDFVQSMGMRKSEVDSSKMLKIALDISRKVKNKNKGFKFAMGGNITKNSISFIQKLASEKLIDKFETRKVVFDIDTINHNPEEAIEFALRFELLWMKSKQRFYSKIKIEDEQRIADLENRIG